MIKKFYQFVKESNILDGEFISSYVKNITPDESDVPDYFISNFINPNKFILTKVKISDLLKSDPSFEEYVNSGEDRYADYMDEYPSSEELYDPVVVVNGEVMDGYNRMTVLKSMGEDIVDAYVNTPS